MTTRIHLLPKGESIAPLPKLRPTVQRSLDMNVISGAFSFVVPTPIPQALHSKNNYHKTMNNQFRNHC